MLSQATGPILPESRLYAGRQLHSGLPDAAELQRVGYVLAVSILRAEPSASVAGPILRRVPISQHLLPPLQSPPAR